MNVLVLGGTNFIGAHAVRRLVALGHDVTVFHRGETAAELPPSARHLYGDRKQLSEYADQFRQLAPEVVLDTRAMTEQDARNVVHTFTGVAEHLVVLSSGDVYRAYDRLRGADPGPPDPTPLTETSPLRDKLYPYRRYAESPEDEMYSYDKILVERVVMARPDRLPGTVLRLPMVFGPGDYQHRLFGYLKRMDDERPFIILPEKQAPLRALRGYVEDMAEAISLCVVKEAAADRIYNVAYQENFTEEQFLELVAAAAGWHGDILKVPNEGLPEPLAWNADENPAQDWSVDSSRIREELGYRELVPQDEALRRAVAWERANPPSESPADRFDYGAEDEIVTAYLNR